MTVSGPVRCESVASMRMMMPRSPISSSPARRAPAVVRTAVAPKSRAIRMSRAGSSVPGWMPK